MKYTGWIIEKVERRGPGFLACVTHRRWSFFGSKIVTGWCFKGLGKWYWTHNREHVVSAELVQKLDDFLDATRIAEELGIPLTPGVL